MYSFEIHCSSWGGPGDSTDWEMDYIFTDEEIRTMLNAYEGDPDSEIVDVDAVEEIYKNVFDAMVKEQIQIIKDDLLDLAFDYAVDVGELDEDENTEEDVTDEMIRNYVTEYLSCDIDLPSLEELEKTEVESDYTVHPGEMVIRQNEYFYCCPICHQRATVDESCNHIAYICDTVNFIIEYIDDVFLDAFVSVVGKMSRDFLEENDLLYDFEEDVEPAEISNEQWRAILSEKLYPDMIDEIEATIGLPEKIARLEWVEQYDAYVGGGMKVAAVEIK